jgi:hypothetical protein
MSGCKASQTAKKVRQQGNEKNVETVMVNNSTNINKRKNLLSPQLIKDHDI